MPHRIALLSTILVASAAVAGPLTPPPGAPASTNLTLAEVEPRTPISGPTTITQPGSYFLTGDVNTTFRGVEIQTSGVTLDLNGFTINGDNVGTSADIGVLVSAVSTELPVVVKNGFIRNFTGDGLATSSSAVHIIVENVHVIDTADGFDVLGSATFVDCSSRRAFGDGFRVSATGLGSLDRCVAEDSAAEGFQVDNCTVRDCIARSNTTNGFSLGSDTTANGCVSISNGLGFLMSAGTTLTDCAAAANTGRGFSGSTGCTFINCAARSNGDIGFITSNGSSLFNCTSRLNTLEGFLIGAGSVATNCAATSNGEDGFQLSSDARVSQCAADGNGSAGATFAGFRGSSDTTIDSCTATDNPVGFVGGVGGLVIRCAAAGNTTNWDLGGSDHGDILTPAGAFTSTNAFANISY